MHMVKMVFSFSIDNSVIEKESNLDLILLDKLFMLTSISNGSNAIHPGKPEATESVYLDFSPPTTTLFMKA